MESVGILREEEEVVKLSDKHSLKQQPKEAVLSANQGERCKLGVSWTMDIELLLKVSS